MPMLTVVKTSRPLRIDRRFQFLVNSFGYRYGFVGIRQIFQQDRKLVTSHARYRVRWAQTRLQFARDANQ